MAFRRCRNLDFSGICFKIKKIVPTLEWLVYSRPKLKHLELYGSVFFCKTRVPAEHYSASLERSLVSTLLTYSSPALLSLQNSGIRIVFTKYIPNHNISMGSYGMMKLIFPGHVHFVPVLCIRSETGRIQYKWALQMWVRICKRLRSPEVDSWAP